MADLDDAAQSGAEPAKVEYLRWSCDRLEGLISAESHRHEVLDNKAVQVFGAVTAAALTAMGLISTPLVPMTYWLAGAAAIPSLCALACSGWAILATRLPAATPAVFTFYDATQWKEDWTTRTEKTRDHYYEAAAKAQAFSVTKGTWVWRAQVSGATSLALIAVLVLVQRLLAP